MTKRTFSIAILFSLCLCSCKINKHYKEFKISDVTKPISDTLRYKTEDVTSHVLIKIKGSINGIAYIEFERGVGRFKKIELTGKVNEIYNAEWYEHNLHFKYTPVSNVAGDSLSIKYLME